MSRNKYILYIAPVLLLVLLVLFASQIRRLQKEVRTSVRIIPGESKTGDDLVQNQLDRDTASSSGRPEVLVKFRAGISEDAIAQIASRFSDRIQDEIEAVPGLTVIDDADNADATVVVAQYQALPEVEYAEPNYEISLAPAGADANRQRVSDPSFDKQWALAKIQAPQAWTVSKGSDEIVVGILDSGVEHTHAALANNTWTRPARIAPYQDRDLGTFDDMLGGDFSGSSPGELLGDSMADPLDDNGQGTFCAGVIGAECGTSARVCGVNQTVRIMALKFINAGGFGTVSGAVQAMNYAIDRKRAGVNLRVISAGWGLAQRSRALEDTIGKAYEAGILFVAAGGDASADNDTAPRYPASFPLGNVVSVAAVDRSDALASFSNYGVKSVHLGAPGKDVFTTALGNDYETRSGTSLAAAVVAGVAALALSAHPNLTVDQLRSLLFNSVDKLPALHGRVSTGGRINAARAVSAK